MKTFEFLADQLPVGFAFNFDNYLFNKVRHMNTQGIRDRADYFVVNNVKRRIEAKIHFLLNDGIAYSPYKSLFGSFEFNPGIHQNVLADFWKFIELDLLKRGCEQVQIVNCAECYSVKKAGVIARVLGKAGFDVALKAVNHHIDISNDAPELHMHEMERRKLKKCRQSGFHFYAEPLKSAGDVHDYLHQCRKEQGINVSISKHKFFQYLELFPKNYRCFTVKNGKEIVAATIAIQVHRKILYNFLPGNLKKYRGYSPMVMLIEGLYRYCQEKEIGMLDLGISTERSGKDQDTLIIFKERVGGKKSYKYFLSKKL